MQRWKWFIAIIALILLVIFITVFINQSLQLLSVFYQISPLLGQITSILLLSFYLAAFLFLVYLYWRTPSGLPPAPAEDSPDYFHYLSAVEKRLRQNEHLKTLSFQQSTGENVKQGMEVLDQRAEEEIKSTAKKVFLFTAISQYGKLDGLVVMVLLLVLTTKITFLYNQRPSLRELIYLYSNVFVTIFLVTEMEDLQIIEAQLEPLVESVGSGMAIAAGATSAGSFIMSAVLQGAANAFLVMRVGYIARQYSLPLQETKRNAVLRGATVKASRILGSVLSDSIKTVITVFYQSGKKKGVNLMQTGYQSCVNAKDKTLDQILEWFPFYNKTK